MIESFPTTDAYAIFSEGIDRIANAYQKVPRAIQSGTTMSNRIRPLRVSGVSRSYAILIESTIFIAEPRRLPGKIPVRTPGQLPHAVFSGSLALRDDLSSMMTEG